MTQIVEIPTSELTLTAEDVLAQQGVPPGTQMRTDIAEICTRSLELLHETATTVGIVSEISLQEFANVFEGEGGNEADTPVGEIYGQSEHLLLFAVTVGKETSNEIDRLFQANDFALGCMLDAAASVTADRAAARIEHRFAASLAGTGWSLESGAALRYSPGYCGWHISGQKKLFEYLKPEQVGITLRDSYLMEPLKSVSGVVLAGPREMHEFDPSFPSCDFCDTYSCRDRISALFNRRQR
jgi:hypothetical protein